MSAAKIATGEIECAISVGSDTTSDAPIVFSKKFSKRLVELGQQGRRRSTSSRSSRACRPPNWRRNRRASPSRARVLSMGQHCELMAQEWQIARADQDQLAYESHKKGAAAYDEGYMDDLVVPCAGVYRDNNLRPDITLEKLASLKPAFEKSERGTLTAGNSTPLTDGAATVLLASEEWAKQRNLPVLAYSRMASTSPTTSSAATGC